MGKEIVSTVTALLPYPPERVWAVVTDLENWQWRSDLSRLEHTGENALRSTTKAAFPPASPSQQAARLPSGPLTSGTPT